MASSCDRDRDFPGQCLIPFHEIALFPLVLQRVLHHYAARGRFGREALQGRSGREPHQAVVIPESAFFENGQGFLILRGAMGVDAGGPSIGGAKGPGPGPARPPAAYTARFRPPTGPAARDRAVPETDRSAPLGSPRRNPTPRRSARRSFQRHFPGPDPPIPPGSFFSIIRFSLRFSACRFAFTIILL